MGCRGCKDKVTYAKAEKVAPWETPIQACFCINLRARKDRWSDFEGGLPAWGLPEIRRWDATVGRKIPKPEWWKAGGGAFGCYLSHMRIYEHMFQNDIGVALVLEDDAKFQPDFGRSLEQVFEEVPDGWQQLYLGGQFLKAKKVQPKVVSTHLLKPFNVNRTHAYVVTLTGARTLYRELQDFDAWKQKPNHHIDHRMGLIHESGTFPVFAASPWLVGQRACRSNVNGALSKERFWDPAQPDQEKLPAFFPVIGTHRSGSSLVARILVVLGAHLGNKLSGYESGRAGGGSEAKGLAHLCEDYMRFPARVPMGDRKIALKKLKNWIVQRRREALRMGTVAGGKYPHLALMGDLLDEACPDAKPIHIVRDLGASVRSLQARSEKAAPGTFLHAGPDDCRDLQAALDAAARQYVQDKDTLVLRYEDLLQDPRSAVESILKHTGVKCSREKVEEAISLVDSKHNHHPSRPMAPKPSVELVA